MRVDHYADSRDEHKWTIAIKQARKAGQSIFWVVMLRSTAHDRAPVADALPEVTEFFAEERRQLDEDNRKSLARMESLGKRLGIDLICHLDAYPSALAQRAEYIDRIVKKLDARPSHVRYLVLLDPDNGIGKSTSNGKQVHISHLQEVWKALRRGDTLGLVQFQHRIGDWVTALQIRIAEVLGLRVEQVRAFPWANLCLYLIDRSVEDRTVPRLSRSAKVI